VFSQRVEIELTSVPEPEPSTDTRITTTSIYVETKIRGNDRKKGNLKEIKFCIYFSISPISKVGKIGIYVTFLKT